jgi:hypothetical protein
MGTSSCNDLCGATKKESFLSNIMLIVRVYGVIPLEFLKSDESFLAHIMSIVRVNRMITSEVLK